MTDSAGDGYYPDPSVYKGHLLCWNNDGSYLDTMNPEAVVAVHVNGRTFVLPWAPFEADITDALREGTNEVTIEVIGGRKNILGPLHVPWQMWTGPTEFDPNNPGWTDDYLLVGHGLMSEVVLETRG